MKENKRDIPLQEPQMKEIQKVSLYTSLTTTHRFWEGFGSFLLLLKDSKPIKNIVSNVKLVQQWLINSTLFSLKSNASTHTPGHSSSTSAALQTII